MRRIRVSSTVDSIEGAEAMSRVMTHEGLTADLVLEVEAGSGRTGVPATEAVALGDRIGDLPGVRLMGVMVFAPGYVNGLEAQRAMGEGEGALVADTAAALRASGHRITFVTAGCTPTSPWAAQVPGVTHVRAGNYVFHDRKQVAMGNATLDDCAISVLATVVSRPAARRYVLDAGLKSLAGEDYGWGTYGQLLEHPDVVVSWAAEEHGVIDVPSEIPDPGLRIGDRVRVVPNHACGLANMHDELVIVDDGRVVDRWPLIARGRVR
jgi:D-serine deaminase-like pyridoxal phosphate-dependent protein